MNMITIWIGDQQIHIDPALNAAIDCQPDGLYLRARELSPIFPAPGAVSVPMAEAIPEPRKSKRASRRIQTTIKRAQAGEGPLDLCLNREITPLTLMQTLSGQGYYESRGGSLMIWKRHYAAHRQEWNAIFTAGYNIPADIVAEIPSVSVNPD